MKRFLLIEDIDAFRGIYSLNFKAYLNAACTVKINFKDAQIYLKDNSERVDMVIIHNSKSNPQVSTELVPYLKKNNLDYPILVVGEQIEHQAEVQYIANSLDVKSIIRKSAQMMGITAQQMAELEVPNFFPIGIDHFKRIKKTNLEIFISAGDKGYKQIFKPHQDIDYKLIDNLKISGESKLYIKKDDRLSFVNYLTQTQVSQIGSEYLSDNEQVSASSMMNELVSSKISELGITPETVSEANSNMKQIATMGSKSRIMKDLLKNLINNSDNFLFQHTVMLNFLTNHIAKTMSWGLEEKRMKLSFVAFFHDITLKTPELAQIHSKVELHNARLSDKDFELVENHAHKSAELITKFPHAPMGVDQLIRQHHGSLNGVGFQESFSSALSPMVLTFIVAEEFTHLVLKNNGHVVPTETIISILRERFPTGRFKRIIDGLAQLS